MNIGKENEYIEFKESLTELEAGVKSISSMLIEVTMLQFILV